MSNAKLGYWEHIDTEPDGKRAVTITLGNAPNNGLSVRHELPTGATDGIVRAETIKARLELARVLRNVAAQLERLVETPPEVAE